jgi:hypothetical protein
VKNTTKLRLPFTNEWFVLNGGDSVTVNHHYGNKAQNFAFDFTKLDKANKSFKNDGKSNEDYYCFDQPIVAPASGIIAEAVDGVKDNKPSQGNYLAGAGNYIVIKHNEKEYSFIAHLQQGSVQVKAGDNVRTGDKLGKSGNSGTSFAPHLHYHLQNSPVLVKYTCNYDANDRTKGSFPATIDFEEYAQGIEVKFSNVIVNGSKKQSHSPVRGDLIRNRGR